MLTMTLAASMLVAGGGEAPAISATHAVDRYCEPLLAGQTAEGVKQAALREGFEQVTVAGQNVLKGGETLVALSDAPRVCFVQAPSEMTRAQGFAFADAWAARSPGAVRSPTTVGPDGSPVRGWSAPKRKLSLVATEQTVGTGITVMAFILAPMP